MAAQTMAPSMTTAQSLAPAAVPMTTDTQDLLASLAKVAQLTDSALTNAGLLSVLLQGSKLPAIYVQPEEDRPNKGYDVITLNDEMVQLPEVDLSVFSSGDGPARAKALATMVEACETWGFVQVVNHAVDLELVKRCESEAHRLFHLPVHAKEGALRRPGAVYGYGSNFWVNLPAMNWAESFHVNYDNVEEYSAKVWDSPVDYRKFSRTVREYIEQVEALGHRVRRILTEGLGLPPTKLDPHFEESTCGNLRLNFYPVCPEPGKALGQRVHRDPHFITLLHQDSVGGLQIWSDQKEEWYNVKPNPDSFIINIGDIFQAASNGRYKSVLHRAVVNDKSSRLSMAYFYNTGATIVAPPELITEETPQKYKPFSWKEYVKLAYTYTTGSASHLDEFFSCKGKNLADSPMSDYRTLFPDTPSGRNSDTV